MEIKARTTSTLLMTAISFMAISALMLGALLFSEVEIAEHRGILAMVMCGVGLIVYGATKR